MTTLEQFKAEWHNASPRLLVHTSGSTGTPKPLWVEKRRMEASARMTCRFLGLAAGQTALLCLPLDYIAGKMMVVRALTCGLRLVSVEPDGHPLATIADDNVPHFAAMVPLQVYNSLQVSAERERLRRVRHLLIGGGPIDTRLASELRSFPNAVWSSYGMTETLSHIALRRLNGPDATDWYTPLEGVTVSINSDGCLVVDAPHVAPATIVTNDLAQLSDDGTCKQTETNDTVRRFRITGRRDNVVCSGGIKIQIEEAERLVAAHATCPFMLTGRRDEKFGEVLVLLCQPQHTDTLLQACHTALPRHWQPRLVVTVDSLPLTPTGKPARAQARLLAAGT